MVIFFPCFSVKAAELHVGTGQTYSTINSAITDSTSGDIIIIHSGTYLEDSLTPKSNTTIQGALGETRPIIDAQQYGVDIDIFVFILKSVSQVTLDRLDIRGGGTRGITIGNEGSGVDHLTISNCKISETNLGGTLTTYNPAHIKLPYQEGANFITITNCEITGSEAAALKIDARERAFS